MASDERKNLEARADERNIRLPYSVGLPGRHDPDPEDEAVRENGLTFLERMVDGVGEMDSGSLGSIICSYWPASMSEDVTDQRS